jgi:hypothetical protein
MDQSSISDSYPMVQLLCVRVQETPSTHLPSGAQGKVQADLVRYVVPIGDVPRRMDHVASPVLRCQVLN